MLTFNASNRLFRMKPVLPAIDSYFDSNQQQDVKKSPMKETILSFQAADNSNMGMYGMSKQSVPPLRPQGLNEGGTRPITSMPFAQNMGTIPSTPGSRMPTPHIANTSRKNTPFSPTGLNTANNNAMPPIISALPYTDYNGGYIGNIGGLGGGGSTMSLISKYSNYKDESVANDSKRMKLTSGGGVSGGGSLVSRAPSLASNKSKEPNVSEADQILAKLDPLSLNIAAHLHPKFTAYALQEQVDGDEDDDEWDFDEESMSFNDQSANSSYLEGIASSRENVLAYGARKRMRIRAEKLVDYSFTKRLFIG